MYFIKKNAPRFFVVLLAFGLVACQPDDIVETVAQEEIDLAMEDATVTATYDDVEEYTFEAMEVADASLEARDMTAYQYSIPACATVTHDSVNKTITIDFGTGCTGPGGKTRSGQIVITYTQRLYIPGASLSTTLVNYVVDGHAVEGTKTITNVSPNFQAPISLNVTLVDGQITFPNGDVASRDADKTYTWMRANRPLNDEFHVDGNTSGSNRDGVTYTTDILSTLIFKRKCRRQGIRIPVEGLKEIDKSNRPVVLLDFGDGSCDHLVTVTVNGNSTVIDVSQQ
ncbi:MAG: hypothetical protein AAF206_12630 [Bacteroidota bacterium]